MRKWLILILALCGAFAASSQEISHYFLQAEISMEKRTVHVEGSLEVHWEFCDHIELALWKKCEIISVTSESNVLDYSFDPSVSPVPYYIPDAGTLVIPRPEGKEGSSTLNLEYLLEMDSVSGWGRSFTPEWLEIGYYTAWYPVHPESGSFTFWTEVAIDPGMKVSGSGTVEKKEGHTLIMSPWTTSDIVIVASRELKNLKSQTNYYHMSQGVRSSQSVTVEVVYTDFPPHEASLVGSEAIKAYEFYAGYFDSKEYADMKFVLQPGLFNGGGYARKNFISIRSEGFNDYLIGGIGHEMAHFWWHHAASEDWEDWLNESFAEYSKLIYIRETYGEEAFNILIEHYREMAAEAHPVRGVDREGPGAYETLYMKGALILHEFENRLGRDEFRDFLRKLNRERISNTDDFLGFLEQNHSTGEREWFEQQLSI